MIMTAFSTTIGASTQDEPPPYNVTFNTPANTTGLTPLVFLQSACNYSSGDIFDMRVNNVVDNGNGTSTLTMYVSRVNTAGNVSDPKGWGMDLNVNVLVIYTPPGRPKPPA